jgi:hypothetical protein
LLGTFARELREPSGHRACRRPKSGCYAEVDVAGLATKFDELDAVGKISMKKVEKAAATERSPRFRENLAKLKEFEGGPLTRRQAGGLPSGRSTARDAIWRSALIINDIK